MPPGNREPGLAGTGNLGSGDGKLERALSWPPLGVCGVPGMAPPPGVLSPRKGPSLVGVWGVCGPPGYLGGWFAVSAMLLLGVWGPGVEEFLCVSFG